MFSFPRSLFPFVISSEQLVSRNVGCFLSSSLPVCTAALLALCLSWHQGAGGSSAAAVLVTVSSVFFFESHISRLLYVVSLQGERKCLTFYLPKLIIVGLLWLSAVTLGIWQT